ATRVRPPVAVEDRLVVRGCRERQHVVAVGEGEERDLLPREELFDDDRRARDAERLPLQALADGLIGLGEGPAHDGALAPREPVRLDDERRAALATVAAGGGGGAEGRAPRCRDLGGLRQALRKRRGAPDC